MIIERLRSRDSGKLVRITKERLADKNQYDKVNWDTEKKGIVMTDFPTAPQLIQRGFPVSETPIHAPPVDGPETEVEPSDEVAPQAEAVDTSFLDSDVSNNA